MEHRLRKLVESYRILFGVEGPLRSDSLARVTGAELKSAFRQRVLETHPDRSRVLGQDATTLHERFTVVTAAHRRLQAFLGGGGPRFFVAAGQSHPGDGASGEGRRRGRQREPPARVPADYYYRGELPRRGLLLGEFAYFSGRVSWRALTSAIFWQRRQRPLIGQIAVQLGSLTASEVVEILARRVGEGRRWERFVRFARWGGYLTPYQRAVLLGRQRLLHRPIGEFFVERGFLGPRDLERLVAEARLHNARFDFRL